MRVHEVFTPNSYPEHTYVEREKDDLEDTLENALLMRGGIASIYGPSKSGKSMLVQRVAEKMDFRDMAIVKGSNIGSVNDLWNEVLDDLGAPATVEHHSQHTDESGESVNGGFQMGPVSIGGEAHESRSESATDVRSHNRRGLKQLTSIIDTDDFVLLIDDFHYIDGSVQPKIAESIKSAAERGISICVAHVEYRRENLEKVNPDLTGRVRGIKLNYWQPDELKQIAEKGFDKLNISASDQLVDHLVTEAAGSPQLMQLLCFSSCIAFGIKEKQTDGEKAEISADRSRVKDVFQEAIEWAGVNDVVGTINDGAETRGTTRNLYPLNNGEKGDYYKCCLYAIADNPPQFSFHRGDLHDRVKEVCKKDHPAKSQVTNFCNQMESLADDERPKASLVTWDEEESYLHISEPGLLFSIRWSIRLDDLTNS